jgi:hypothetical protein
MASFFCGCVCQLSEQRKPYGREMPFKVEAEGALVGEAGRAAQGTVLL